MLKHADATAGRGSVRCGTLLLFWQVDHHEARRFIEQNPWFAGMPFLMLESPPREPRGLR